MHQRGSCLLKKCIEAEYYYRLSVEEYKEIREKVFASLYPSYETKYGEIRLETISTENAVIHIIETEERIREEIKHLQPKRKLLQQVLKKLNKDELEVFNHVVWGKPCNFNRDRIEQASLRINEKMCKHLESMAVIK